MTPYWQRSCQACRVSPISSGSCGFSRSCILRSACPARLLPGHVAIAVTANEPKWCNRCPFGSPVDAEGLEPCHVGQLPARPRGVCPMVPGRPRIGKGERPSGLPRGKAPGETLAAQCGPVPLGCAGVLPTCRRHGDDHRRSNREPGPAAAWAAPAGVAVGGRGRTAAGGAEERRPRERACRVPRPGDAGNPLRDRPARVRTGVADAHRPEPASRNGPGGGQGRQGTSRAPGRDRHRLDRTLSRHRPPLDLEGPRQSRRCSSPTGAGR